MDLEQLKLASTLAAPFIKEIIEKHISPGVKYLIDAKKVSIRMTAHSFENQFQVYLAEAYKKHSVINLMALSNQKRLLKDMYIPLEVINEDDKSVSYIIDGFSNDFIPYYKQVLIIDTAGMGKTTIAKRLFLAAVEQSVGVPMIIELRRLSKDNEILDEIFRQLSLINEKVDELFVLELIRRGGFIFMLDGFDEIENDNRRFVIENVRNFIDKASKNYFLLTSRREDALGVFSDFVSFNIRDLSLDEAKDLLIKHDNRGEISALLVKKVDNDDNHDVLEFMSNPLLVSLLYAAFEYKQTLPLKKHLFYRQVRDAFFERHDLTKGESYIRSKYTGLSSDDFSRVLRYVGYHSMRINKIEYTKDELLKILENATIFCVNLKFNPSDFIKDVLTKVPLFVADGLYLKWSHKSIQEYFAANFIYFDSGNKKGSILVNICKNNKLSNANTIDLYYGIDYKGFRRYVIYDFLKKYIVFLSEIKGIWPNIKDDIATELFVRKILILKYVSGYGGDIFAGLKFLNLKYDEDGWGCFSVFNRDEERFNYTKVYSQDREYNELLVFLLGKSENHIIDVIDERLPIDGFDSEVNEEDDNFDFTPTSDYSYLNLEKNIPYILDGTQIEDRFKLIDINKFIEDFLFFRYRIRVKEAEELIAEVDMEVAQEENDDFLI